MLAREAAGPLGAVALAAQLTYISFDGEETPTRGYAPNCGRQESRPSYGRGFLTWRIEYFRAAALLLANTRKSEISDFQMLISKASPLGGPKMWFSPLYGTFWGYFSAGKWPWIGNSIPWIGESMGWKWISMGWIGRNTPRGRFFKAKRRTRVGVRFNGLPYSAQALRGVCSEAGCPPRRDAIHRVSMWRISHADEMRCLGGALPRAVGGRNATPPKVASCAGGGDRLRRGFAPNCGRQESRPS